MGWFGTPGERGTHAEIDREIMRGFTSENGTEITYTDCKLVGFNHHYSVRRVNGVPQVICVDLIERSRETRERMEEWRYKPLDETMVPYAFDCPLSLLDMVPCPDYDGAREWREEVRKFHAHRKIKVEAGDTVLAYGREIQITRIQKRTLVYVNKGREWALPRKYVQSVVRKFGEG